jgi:hypothetical protein
MRPTLPEGAKISTAHVVRLVVWVFVTATLSTPSRVSMAVAISASVAFQSMQVVMVELFPASVT